MDGLGDAASVIAVIQLAKYVYKLCQPYVFSDDDARREIQLLCKEIIALHDVLAAIEDQSKGTDSAKPGILSRIQKTHGEPLKRCQDELKRIQYALQEFQSITSPSSQKTMSRVSGRVLKWPFTRQDLKVKIDTLSQGKDALNSTLAADTTQIKDELLDQLWSMLHQPSSPVSNHQAARAKHCHSTGEWLLQSEKFKTWKSTAGKVLWLNGIPGSGKTVLISTVIESLNTLTNDPGSHNTAVAYYYFDFTDTNKQSAHDFVTSVRSQILEQPQAFGVASKLYTQRKLDQGHVPVSGLLDEVLEASTFEHLYIIIDAVDESPRNLHREDVLDVIENLSKHKSCHILAASREEMDISTRFSSIGAIEIKLAGSGIESDIQRYISAQFENDPRLRSLPVALKNDAYDRLSKKANGMFRWVFCQLDELRRCETRQKFDEALTNLPESLSETYQKMIDNLDEQSREKAIDALIWVAFAVRPLTVAEVAESAVLDPEKDQLLDPDDRFVNPVDDILEILGNLVTVRRQRLPKYNLDVESDSSSEYDVVTLAHYTVKEYLLAHWETMNNRDAKGSSGDANLSDRAAEILEKLDALDINKSLKKDMRIYASGKRLDWPAKIRWKTPNGQDIDVIPEAADLFIGKSCLRYITACFYQIGHRITPDKDEFPLLSYASDYWQTHVAALTESHRRQLDPLKAELLREPDSPEKWRHACLYGVPPDSTQLHYAVRHDCLSLVQELLARGVNMKARDSAGRTAAELAACGGNNEVLQVFMAKMSSELCASSDSPGWVEFEKLLYCAQHSGYMDTAHMITDYLKQNHQ